MGRFIVYLSHEGIECFHPLLDRGSFETADEKIVLYEKYMKQVYELNQTVLPKVFKIIFVDKKEVTVDSSSTNTFNLLKKHYMKHGHFEARDDDKGVDFMLSKITSLGDRISGLYGGYYERSTYDQEFDLLQKKYENELAELNDSKSEYKNLASTAYNYQRRKNVVKPGIEIVINFFSNDDMFKLNGMGLAGGFYLLDGLINGKTEIGRFGETKETMYIDDKCDEKCASIKEIKQYRRIFYDKLTHKGDKEDPDEL
jgi:hypothetical protein